MISHPNIEQRWVPNMDVLVNASGELVILVELAGMEPDAAAVEAEGQRVVVRGRRKHPENATAQQLLVHEVNFGPFESMLDVPPEFDPSRLQQSFHNGMLRLVIPAVPPK